MSECSWWLGHDWNKWEQYEWKGVMYKGDKALEIAEVHQRRTCKNCGYMQDQIVRQG